MPQLHKHFNVACNAFLTLLNSTVLTGWFIKMTTCNGIWFQLNWFSSFNLNDDWNSHLFFCYKKTKRKIALKILGTIWGLTILVIITAVISNCSRTPIQLTKSEIVGTYSIDTNFFKGRNAKWQYDHYKFKITKTDSFYFYLTRKDTVLKTFTGRVKYSSGPPDLWTIQSDTQYHVIKYPPTLFRGHSNFYYVFHSDIYGNMFLRKQN